MARKAKTEMLGVLTIGHSTRMWNDFLKLLREHGIKRVIDVRAGYFMENLFMSIEPYRTNRA